MAKKEVYNASSIQVFHGLEAIRKRPGMYVGSTGASGLHQIAYEVLDNSVDEHLGGHCTDIHFTLHTDHSITVEDNGRGIPVDWHEKEQMSALEVALTKMHAGGKFDNETYKTSCFTGDTKIKLLNGTTQTLEWLFENNIKEFWVYSVDENGNFVPGLASCPRITKYEKTLLEITLDNNEKIKCTLDHRFMMRDGTYKEAQFLKENDSLMPLYFREDDCGHFLVKINNPLKRNYQRNRSDAWEFVYRVVIESISRKHNQVHHKDFNSKNDTPENLELLYSGKHLAKHAYRNHANRELCDLFLNNLRNYAKSETGRLKSRKIGLTVGKDNLLKYVLSDENRKDKSLAFKNRNKDEKLIVRWKKSKILKIYNKLKYLQLDWNEQNYVKHQMWNAPNFEKAFLMFENSLSEIEKEHKIWLEEKNKKGFSIESLTQYKTFDKNKRLKNLNNHTVFSVKTIEYEYEVPVYDINVDKYHNFLLDAGVIVHNSGLHGIGVSATNALSKHLKATVYRNKKVYEQEFSKGKRKTDLEIKGKTKKNGTKIHFTPDDSIFKETQYDSKLLKTRFIELSFLNPGLTIEFVDEIHNKNETFHSEKGLINFVQHLAKNKEPLHDTIYVSKKLENFDFDIAFQYNSSFTENIHAFANNVNTVEGGTHLNGAKTALLKFFKNATTKHLKGTNLDVLPKDILEGLVLIVSVRLSNPEFESQTKIKLNNVEVRQKIEDEFTAFLDTISLPPVVFEKIANSVKVRDATNKTRKLVSRKGLLDNSLPGKLADCSETDPAKCELFIVEGASAGGSVKQARDRSTQAVLALKGKILNVEKTTLNKMLDNAEIKDIITSLGVRMMNDGVDVSKLRYHKIIITTDADVDGGHICALLLTFFYKYMRELIENGFLYVAVPPLYKIQLKDQEIFLDNEKQLEEFRTEHKNFTIQRFKGLGEMSVEQLMKTTMHKENRNLIQISIDDCEKTNNLFDVLMGDALEERKQFIIDNSTWVTV